MAFHTEMSNLSPPIICPLPSSLKAKPRREKDPTGFRLLTSKSIKEEVDQLLLRAVSYSDTPQQHRYERDIDPLRYHQSPKHWGFQGLTKQRSLPYYGYLLNTRALDHCSYFEHPQG